MALETGMELNERVDKLESSLDALTKSQKDLLGHVTEQLEKLSQQLADRNKVETKKFSTLTNKSMGKKGAYFSALNSSSSTYNLRGVVRTM